MKNYCNKHNRKLDPSLNNEIDEKNIFSCRSCEWDRK